MKLKKCENYTELSRVCADRVADVLRAKPDALLCFAAGSTSVGMFNALRRMQRDGLTDLRRARFVALDEWLDLADESENCAAFMRRSFYDPLGIAPERIRWFDIHNPDRARMLADMDAFLAAQGPIDCMVLGIGMNGHVGLNEPGTSWDCGALVAELDETTASVGQKYFSQGMRLTRGVTLGMRHIFAARTVILQASGVHKRGIVRQLLACEPSVALPASALRLMPDAWFVYDTELEG